MTWMIFLCLGCSALGAAGVLMASQARSQAEAMGAIAPSVGPIAPSGASLGTLRM